MSGPHDVGPSLGIILRLEARPRIVALVLGDGDADRLRDWLVGQPALCDLLARAAAIRDVGEVPPDAGDVERLVG